MMGMIWAFFYGTLLNATFYYSTVRFDFGHVIGISRPWLNDDCKWFYEANGR